MLDEAQYWTWSRELAFGYFSKPPMIAWLIRVSTDDLRRRRGLHPLGLSGPSHALLLRLVPDRAPALSRRVGFWSAIVFATLPGVSYSSLLITTDVPLVLFWPLRCRSG